MGPSLTVWTIRLSLAVYVACVARELFQATPQREGALWRWLWLIGAMVCAVHIGLALAVFHDFSHLRAVEATARQTEELMGFAFGGGVYFNYLFLAVWLGDAAWRLMAPHGYRQRSRWLGGAVHGYLFFIAVNGAVVFEKGPVRAIGAACVLGLTLLLARRWRRAAIQARGASVE